MLAVWRVHGIDTLMRSVLAQGTILYGSSDDYESDDDDDSVARITSGSEASTSLSWAGPGRWPSSE